MHEYNSIIKNDALFLINVLLCIVPIKSNMDFKGIACFWGLAWETQGPLWRGDVIWPKAWTLTLMTSSTSLSNGQPLGHLLALPSLSVGPIEHLDLHNTILQGDLTKVIYITQPINFWCILPMKSGVPPQTNHLHTTPNSSTLVRYSSRLFLQGLIRSSYEHNLYFHHTNDGLFLSLTPLCRQYIAHME